MRSKTILIVASSMAAAAAMIGGEVAEFPINNPTHEFRAVLRDSEYRPVVTIAEDITFYGEIPLRKRKLYPTKRQIKNLYMKANNCPFVSRNHRIAWYDFYMYAELAKILPPEL